MTMHRHWVVLLAITSALMLAASHADAQSKSGTPTVKLPTPSPSAVPAIAPLPPPAIQAPSSQLPAITPLSPSPVTATTLSSGGTARTDKLPSPTPLSGSPSELAASTAGGGGHTVRECMAYWDRGTHMTKTEWQAACQRSLHRLDNLKINDLDGFAKKKGS